MTPAQLTTLRAAVLSGSRQYRGGIEVMLAFDQFAIAIRDRDAAGTTTLKE